MGGGGAGPWPRPVECPRCRQPVARKNQTQALARPAQPGGQLACRCPGLDGAPRGWRPGTSEAGEHAGGRPPPFSQPPPPPPQKSWHWDLVGSSLSPVNLKTPKSSWVGFPLILMIDASHLHADDPCRWCFPPLGHPVGLGL